MPTKSPKHTSSNHFYAIDFDQVETSTRYFQENSRVCTSYELPAVWFKEKKGDLFVAYGSLSGSIWSKEGDAAPTKEDIRNDFIEKFDGRYGGKAEAKWDGTYFWSPETPWDETVQLQKLLHSYYEQFPKIPDGFDGWWSLK